MKTPHVYQSTTRFCCILSGTIFLVYILEGEIKNPTGQLSLRNPFTELLETYIRVSFKKLLVKAVADWLLPLFSHKISLLSLIGHSGPHLVLQNEEEPNSKFQIIGWKLTVWAQRIAIGYLFFSPAGNLLCLTVSTLQRVFWNKFPLKLVTLICLVTDPLDLFQKKSTWQYFHSVSRPRIRVWPNQT